MYLQYWLIALTVILLAALVLFYVIKKKNQASRENIIYLELCTVLAIVCATLTPLLANIMVKELYFSIFASVFISFILIIALSYFAFTAAKRVIKKKENKTEQEASEESSLKESERVQINEDDSLESWALLNEAAILKDVGYSEAAVTEIETAPTTAADLIPDLVQSVTVRENEPALIQKFLSQAIDNKINHNLSQAILSYKDAIMLKPDAELLELIIIDLCALYKMTNQRDLVYKLLESGQCNLLKYEVKEGILQNL